MLVPLKVNYSSGLTLSDELQVVPEARAFVQKEQRSIKWWDLFRGHRYQTKWWRSDTQDFWVNSEVTNIKNILKNTAKREKRRKRRREETKHLQVQ